MQITFTEDVTLKVLDNDGEGDIIRFNVDFVKGDTFGGEIFGETDSDIDFEFADGSAVMRLSKTLFRADFPEIGMTVLPKDKQEE